MVLSLITVSNPVFYVILLSTTCKFWFLNSYINNNLGQVEPARDPYVKYAWKLSDSEFDGELNKNLIQIERMIPREGIRAFNISIYFGPDTIKYRYVCMKTSDEKIYLWHNKVWLKI